MRIEDLFSKEITLYKIYELKSIAIIIFLVYILFLSGFVILFPPIITGDGNEYVGMTISFYNHFSPDLANDDIIIKNEILNKNNIQLGETVGYIQSLRGTLEASHFWAYSFFVLPVFSFLHFFLPTNWPHFNIPIQFY